MPQAASAVNGTSPLFHTCARQGTGWNGASAEAVVAPPPGTMPTTNAATMANAAAARNLPEIIETRMVPSLPRASPSGFNPPGKAAQV